MSATANGNKPSENGHNVTSNGNGAVVKANDASLLPHLESWDRVMKFPVVEAAWHQSQGVYDKVRGKFEKLIQTRHVKVSYQFINSR
jgi:hypothetical protein